MRRGLLWTIGAVLLVSSTSAAEPQTDTPALETKYHAALDLRAHGEDRQALAIFRDIEATAPSGRSIAQVALAEQAIGSWVRAEEDLLVAFRRGGAWIDRNRVALEGSLATIQQHLGSLEIVCEGCMEAAARARIDGAEVGALPLGHALRLELGRHRLEVRAPGRFDVVRDVEIASGKLVREQVRLVSAPTHPAPAAVPTGAAPRDPAAAHPPPSTEERHSSVPAVLGWTAVGLGAATLGVAVAFGLSSNSAAHDYNDDPSCGDPVKPARCTSLRSDVTTGRSVALVAGIAGGVLAATGITVLVLSVPSRPRVTLLPEGVSLRAQF